MTPRPTPRRAIALVVAVVAMVATTLAGPSAAQTDPEFDQLVVKFVSNYAIRPTEGQVDVVSEITVSNVKNNQVSGDTVTSFFWTGHTVWVPDDAENVSITVEGEPLEWEVVDNAVGVDIIVADFRRNLNFGQTRVIDVTYTLPTYGPGEGVRRINDAFFDLELIICCGFEEVDLTVTVPDNFDIDPPTTLAFDRSRAGGQHVFNFTDNETTGQYTEVFFTTWFGFDEAGLDQTTASEGPLSAAVIYPPDDTTWGEGVATTVSQIGSGLAEITGSPWTSQEVELVQGSNDDFGPWGTEPVAGEDVFIPRDYDERALAATVTRAWLADGPFTDERLTDGLTIDLAAGALERAGTSVTVPTPPTGTATDEDDRFWVMRQISDEIGHEGLGTILQLANDGESAYPGSDGAGAGPSASEDWQRFVDLAERRLDSGTVVPTFDQYLLTDDESALLDDRRSALATYDQVAERADGSMPVGIREAMATWDFSEATSMLTAATAALDERDLVIGDDAARADDAQLALGESWANAESVSDLQALQTDFTDRGAALDRSGLLRTLGIVALSLVLVGAIIAGVILLRRRNRVEATAVPAAAAGGGPVYLPPTNTPNPSAGPAPWPTPDPQQAGAPGGWPAPTPTPNPPPGTPGSPGVAHPANQTVVAPGSGAPGLSSNEPVVAPPDSPGFSSNETVISGGPPPNAPGAGTSDDTKSMGASTPEQPR